MRSQPPKLTDQTALHAHRARVTAAGLFLHDLVRDEVKERLTEVNRTFKAPSVITPYPRVWRGFAPDPVVAPDQTVLDLTPARHDLVIHALALHWADDPVGQLIQCARALQPDGLLIAALFGGQTLAELRHVLTRAEAAVTGGASPRIAPMADLRDLGALLARAGLALPVADSIPLTVTYDDIYALMRDLRAMGETNALAARHKAPLRRDVLDMAARIYATDHAQPDGRIRATFEIMFLTGWSPHASQQKPLQPGSAKMSLAAALTPTDPSEQDDR